MGQSGQEEFVTYSNSGLQPQAQMSDFGIDLGYRLPAFDISVQAQKQTAYTTMAQNELALQFYQMGFFDPARTDQTLMCLDMMDFRGKEEMLQKIRSMGALYDRMMQLTQYAAALAAKHQDATALAQVQAMMSGNPEARAGTAAVEPNAERSQENGLVQKARNQAREASQPGGGT